jgi:HSP20 family protein
MEPPLYDDTAAWVPPTDIYETDNGYMLAAELPGVEKRDIQFEFSGLDITIRGKRRPNAACVNESYQRLEGHRGRFRRTFSLPEPFDAKRMQWELKNGVLHVMLPKSGITKNSVPRRKH